LHVCHVFKAWIFRPYDFPLRSEVKTKLAQSAVLLDCLSRRTLLPKNGSRGQDFRNTSIGFQDYCNQAYEDDLLLLHMFVCVGYINSKRSILNTNLYYTYFLLVSWWQNLLTWVDMLMIFLLLFVHVICSQDAYPHKFKAGLV